MYYFYGKVNQGHVVCPLYGGSPYFRGSVMGHSTIVFTSMNFLFHEHMQVPA